MRFAAMLLTVFMTMFINDSYANHILGGNITYVCLGGNSYQITLTIYKDCFGATNAPSQESVFFFPQGCALPFSANLQLQSVTEISDLCPSELVNSSCNGGFIPGAELLIYSAAITLTDACLWNINWAAGDWNYFLNMDNGMLPTAFIAATIDPTTVGCADSVVPANPLPVNYSCTGDAVTYDLQIDNPNNYDLTYTLICPQTSGGVDAPMFAPCNQLIAGLTMNPVTGQIAFTSPNLFGNYSVAVEIDMFDNGDYVGTIVQSLAFIVRLCAVSPTVFSNPTIQSLDGGGTLLSANSIQACVGDDLCFTVESTNNNIFRSIDLTTNFTTLFPSGSFTQTGINPAIGEFCVLVTEAMIGSTVVTVNALDDACPTPGTAQTQFTLTVSPSAALNIPDTLICFGESVELIASGDAAFTWNVLSGDPNPGLSGSGSTQTITPNIDTEIQVIALNGVPACPAADTVLIAVALSDFQVQLTNESCALNDGAITIGALGGSGNYDYNWPGIPFNGANPTNLAGGDYLVTVSDLGLTAGCTRDTLLSLTTTPPPSGSISGNATLCEGDCTLITFALSGTGPFTVNLRNETTGLLEAVPAVQNGNTFQVCPPTTTTYTLESVTDANNPACTYAIESTVTITVRPEVTAGFDAPTTICAGDAAVLVLNIDQPGIFDLTYAPLGGVPASPLAAADGTAITFAAAAAGNYNVTSVQYTTAPFCPGTVLPAVNLVVNNLPTATADDDVEVCSNELLALEIMLTGTGPWEVTHDFAGEASPLLIAASPYTWNFTNLLPLDQVITLTNVLDLGTNCSSNINEVIAITSNPAPVVNLLGNQTLCFGGSGNLLFELMGDGPFDVLYNAGGPDLSLLGINDQHSLAVSPLATTNYCIESVTDDNSCTTAPGNCVTVDVLPESTVAFSSTDGAVCLGDCLDLAFDFTNGSGPWELTLELTDGNGTATDVVILNSGETYTVCPTEAVTIELVGAVDQGDNCTATLASATVVNISVTSISTVSLSGAADLCAGECTDLELVFTDAVGPLNFTIDGSPFTGVDPAVDLINGVFTYNVCPLANTTYTVSAYSDDGNACVAIGNASVDVNIYALPDVEFTGGASICNGESVDLVFNTNTANPLDVVIEVTAGTNPATQTTVNGVNLGDLFSVSPVENTVYAVVSVSDPNTPAQCATAPNASVTVDVGFPLAISEVDTLCAPNALSYQLSFVVSGGSPASYAVDVAGGLTPFNGGPDQVFLSNPLDPSVATTFTATDAFGCGSAVITIDPFTCPSITFAGTVDVTPQSYCNEGILSTTANGDENLDSDDVLSFVIHSGSGTQLGTVYYISNVPQWDIANDLDFPGVLTFGTTYYLSAVAADNDGTGLADLNSGIVNVSQGMPFTVIESPTASISGGGSLCEGETLDLVIDFTGTGPYTIEYAIDGFPAFDNPITPINTSPYLLNTGTAGSYTLLSVSNDVCAGVFDGQADVVVNPLPTADLSGGGTLCEGSSIDLPIALTGTAPWTVTIGHDINGDGSSDASSTLPFNATPDVVTVSLGGDWFVLSVEDATGCVNTSNGALVNVEIVPLPEAQFTFGDTSFCAGTTIDISIELTGEAPWNLDYGVAGGPFNEVVNTSPYTFTTGENGSVCVSTLTDANGCVAANNPCIELTVLPVPVADAGADLSICVGESTMLGTLGDPLLTYTWTDASLLDDGALAQPTFTAPAVNVQTTYTFELEVSAAGCVSLDEVVITVEPLPLADAGLPGSICSGDTYTLQAAGGVSYLWTDNGTFTSGGQGTANPTVEPLADTVYEVTVTDANNCVATATVDVSVADPIDVQVTVSAVVCYDACDGIIDLALTGGYGGYEVSWAEVAENTALLENLCAGDYTYTITDSEGCTATDVVSLAENAPYFIADVEIIPGACFGENTGTINVTSPEAVLFDLNAGAVSNGSGAFTNLAAGDYTIVVTDGLGCQADTTVSFTNSSAPIDIAVDFETLIICVGDAVVFGANAFGGDGIFNYAWYADAAATDLVSNDNPFNWVAQDSLTLFVVATDGLGCNSDTLSASIYFQDPLTIDLGENQNIEICENECIDLFAETAGGNGNLNVEWTSSLTGAAVLATGNSANFCPPGTLEMYYVATVDDGCVAPATDTVFVFIYNQPVPLIGYDVSEGCFPVTVNFENLTDPSFFGNCEWNFNDGNTLPACTDVTYTYNSPGTYVPSLTVTSPFGCVGTAEIDVPIEVSGYPIADFSWSPQLTTLQTTLRYEDRSTGAVSYEWTFEGIGTSEDQNPSVTYPSDDATTWITCLKVTNLVGCTDSICYFIDMQSEVLIYVPNAFTPDNDNLNELFYPVIGGGISTQDFSFSIWDRWGEKLFETDQIGVGWNGSVNRGSYYVEAEAYIWRVVYREIDSGEKRELKGHVILVR